MRCPPFPSEASGGDDRSAEVGELARGIVTAGQDGAAGLGSGVWSRLEPDRPTAGRVHMNCRDLRRLEIGNIQEGVALVSKGRNFDHDDVTYPPPALRKAGIAMPSRMAAPSRSPAASAGDCSAS